MPSPAADAPFPERAFNVTALKWNTCAWLLLPVLVFMAWWMHWYVSIPLAALMAAGLAPGRRKELPERESLPSFPLFNRSSFLVLGAFIALMVLSGWGEWVNQHPDHIVRNACLRELVASPWPVVFPDGDVLIYNTGFWLVPALAGKVAGLEVARAFVVLWGAWGLFLAWLWLCVFSGRRSLLLALLMVMFGSLLNFQCWLGLDLFRLHYFGTAEQVMCSANASIPVMLFFIFLASGRMPPHWMPLLFAATAFYSPLAALGGLPLAVCQWLRQWKGSRSPPAQPASSLLSGSRHAGGVLPSLLCGGKRAVLPYGLAAFLYAAGGFSAGRDLLPAVRPVLLAGFPAEFPLYLYAGNRTAAALLLRQRRRQRPALQGERSGDGLPARLSGLHLGAASPSPDMDMASAGARIGAPVQCSLLLLFFQRPPGISDALRLMHGAFLLSLPGMAAAHLCAAGTPPG